METPIELLKKELSVRLFIANRKGFSHKKNQSKKLIPLYEKAIEVLEELQNNSCTLFDIETRGCNAEYMCEHKVNGVSKCGIISVGEALLTK